jgi:hypothetical protein
MDAISEISVDLPRRVQCNLQIGGLRSSITRPRTRRTWTCGSIRRLERRRANAALAEFGSPFLLAADDPAEILQIGLPPNRIDLLRLIEGPPFGNAWKRRIIGRYGRAAANWIDLESLIQLKSRIDDPRHRRDVRDLEAVRALRHRPTKPGTKVRAASPRKPGKKGN